MNILSTPLSSPLGRLVCAAAGCATVALAAGSFPADTLTTSYSTDRSFTVSVSTKTSSETTTVMTMDGEPMGRDGGGPRGVERTMSYSYTDTPLAVHDGTPTKVERSFDEISGTTSMEMRGEPMDIEVESAFEGLTIVFTDKDGDVEAEVTDGDAPDDDERLQGHRLALPLDSLMPDDEIEAGDTWEIDSEALLIALGIGMDAKLVDRPERGGGRGGGGRGGRGRGGRFGGGGGSGLGALASLEWSTTATYTGETEEAGGVECVIITLKTEVEGSIERSFGGRGRDRAPRELALSESIGSVPQDTEYEGEFEGRLLWCLAESRPVQLTFKGTYESEMEFERETDNGLMEMSSESETSVSITIEIGAQAAGSDD